MLEIKPIASFGDNYIWMLRNPGEKRVIVVDPGDSKIVMKWLAEQDFELAAVLITHFHNDHTGGIADLLAHTPNLAIYGPKLEDIPGVNHPVSDGDMVEVDGVVGRFQVLDASGHTAGQIAYYGEGALFPGDALFSVGCGRIFNGTYQQMTATLNRFAELPGDTQIYSAHEYTLDNIGFAKWVEPENSATLIWEQESRNRRAAGQATLPTTLRDELAINPFLRLSEPEVIAAAEKFTGHSTLNEVEVFTAIRMWKDEKYD